MTYVNNYLALLTDKSLAGRSSTGGPLSNNPLFISYSFEKTPYQLANDGSLATMSSAFSNSFVPLNSSQQAAARNAFSQWDSSSGITFIEVPAGSGDIKLASFNFSLGGSALSTDAVAYGGEGVVFVSSQSPYDQVQLYLHEIGHALDLKHPFEGNYILPSSLDNFSSTIMSDTSGGFSGNTLGPLDRAAASFLYGNPSSDGHQVSSWSWNATTSTLTQIALPSGGNLRGIGGNNILFGSANADIIDITGDTLSNMITTGPGDDVISVLGTVEYNSIAAGDGNDVISITASLSSSFKLDGGNGYDSLNFVANPYTGLSFFSLKQSLSSGSSISNIEAVSFVGSGLSDYFVGGPIASDLYGYGGDDVLIGGSQDDKIYGGDGADIIRGGLGQDELSGGLGADRFTGTVSELNGDMIDDFSSLDIIVIKDAVYQNFSAKLNGATLMFTGGSLTLANSFKGYIVFSADATGGVDLRIIEPALHFVDFDGNGVADVLVRSISGSALSSWILASVGPGVMSSTSNGPGSNYRVVGFGDFNGDLKAELLFRGRDGSIGTLSLLDPSSVAGSNLGNPGVANIVAGTADYNLDGKADILFYNGLTGAYATWNMNNTVIAGGGTIGIPGSAWIYKATADFNGDGDGDILFQNVNGTYALWSLNDTTVTSSGSIGNPGARYFFKGVGDFNGDGKTDILFQNANGVFATWDLDGTTIIGGGQIGYTPAGYNFTSIGDYNGDGKSDIMFTRTSDGVKFVWYMNDFVIDHQLSIGSPGTNVVQDNGHGANYFGSVVFQDSINSTVASWLTGINSVVGGGTFGQPGSAYAAIATGDFAGTGEIDVLFHNTSGAYATWTTNGSMLIGGGTLGNPGSAYTFRAAADFNGDGKTDILFQNSNGTYATWDIGNASTISGGGNIGVASGFTFAAAGDINGDGKADLIFKGASGVYAAWLINDTTILAGSGTIGSPGDGWTLKGMGDFNGDGKADVLFQNVNGAYATWDLDGIRIIGGGNLGNPGGSFALAKIVDINGDGRSDLLFADSSGKYASWLISDTNIIGGGVLGTVSSSYHVV